MKKKHKLLIVDDEPEILSSLERQFKRKYQVFTTTSAKDALELLKHESIQLIISDQRMPEMSGAEFLAIVNRLYPSALKLLLTAYSDIEAVVKAINEGQVYRYITKPWLVDELDSIVEQAFEKHDLTVNRDKLLKKLAIANKELESKVKQRTSELEETNKSLKDSIQANKKNQDLIESVFNSIPGILYLYDDNGKLIRWNRRFELITGYSTDELKDIYMMDFFKDDFEHQRVINLALNTVALKGFAETDAEITTKNGKRIPMHLTGCPLFVDGKEYLTGIGLDNTNYYKTLEQLKRSEDKYRNIIQNLSSAYALHEIILDKAGKPVDYRFLEVNQAFEEMTGLKAKRVLGKTCLEVLPGTEKYWIDTYGEIALTGKRITFENFSSVLDRHYQVSAYSTEKNKFSTVFVDITNIKKSEERYRLSEAKFHKLFDDHEAVELLIDPISYQILDANKAAVEFYGWSKKELLKMSMTQINTLSHEELKLKFDEIDNKAIHYFEFKHLHKDGSVTDVEVFSTEVEIDEKPVLHSIIHDITTRKVTEKALQKSENMLNMFFSQSLDGFFFLMLDEPQYWNDKADKEKLLDYMFEHQHITRANEAMIKVFHATPEQLIGATPSQFYANDIELGRKVWTRLYNEQAMHVDLDFIAFDGQPITIEGNYVCMYDDEGRVLGHFGILRDITNKRREEEEMKANYRLIRIAAETAQFGGWTFQPGDEYLTWSDLVCDIHEVPHGSRIKATEAIKFYAPESVDKVNLVFSDCITKGLPFDTELKIITAKGNKIWVRITGEALKDIDGNIVSIQGSLQNIDKVKRADLELIELQSLYYSFIEHLPGAVFRKDADGRYVFVNQIFCKAKGTTAEEVIGKTPRELFAYEQAKFSKIPPDNEFNQRTLIEGEDHHQIIMRTGQRIEDEEIYSTPDGEKHFYQVIKSPVFGFDGKIIGSQGIQFDITDRKNAEMALKESERKLSTLISNLPGFVYRCNFDSNWTMIYISEGCKEITGYNQDELIANHKISFNALIHDSHREDIVRKWESVLKAGEVFQHEYQIRTKSGEIRWVWEQGRGITNKDGKVLYLEGFITDVTQRKLAEDALQYSEEKFRTLFNEMADVVVMCSLIYNADREVVDYCLEDFNDAFSKVFGLKRSKVLGMKVSDVMQVKIVPYVKELSLVANKGEKFDFSFFEPHVNKQFQVSAVSPQKGIFALIATDITALVKYNNMLIEKNKELESYVYITSHDLRSPLVNIQGFSNRLKKQTELINSVIQNCNIEAEQKQIIDANISEKIPTTLDFIFNNVVKMEKMLNGLLQISRTGRVAMNIQPVNMNELMIRILKSVNFQLNEIMAEVQCDELPECYGDDALLNQLFSNLISNSIKYRDPSRKLVITISAESRYHKVVYRISDNGIGVSAPHLEKIWNVFFRVDPKNKAGEGIGLSIVKRIVEKHQGKIRIESEVNIGTTFYIELPNFPFTVEN